MSRKKVKYAVKLEAFRAIDNPSLCRDFIIGHSGVLQSFGIKSVTSSEPNWVNNPNSYVIVAFSELDNRMVAGIRVHVHDTNWPLPMVDAIFSKDSKIEDYVLEKARSGTGEICGLWNDRIVKGYGISNVLIRTAVVIINQLPISSLLGLCSPYTMEWLKNSGFIKERTLGNDGEFYYPKDDLIATSIIIPDPNELQFAKSIVRDQINELRENKVGFFLDELGGITLRINYNLDL